MKFIFYTVLVWLHMAVESSGDSAIEGEYCNLFVSITDYEDGEERSIQAECEITGLYYPVIWSEDYVKELVRTKNLVSGKSTLSMLGVKIEEEGLHIVEGTENISTSTDEWGRLEQRNISVLVVRVIASDNAPNLTREQLSDKVFGTDGDKANLKSQYSQCSYNQMNFVPAINQDSGVINGVLEINIDMNATNASSRDIQNEVTNVLGGKPFYADHVMYCLPPGTLGRWIAYGYTNNWLTVYNDKWCNYLSVQMHEIGHNLGLGHAGENGVSYGDKSGYMGYSYAQDDTPLMCFNAFHSWKLGWYITKSVVVPKGGSFSGNLSGFVDYGNSGAETVLIRLERNNNDSDSDFFVNYNKKTGFNSGTLTGGDQVLVVYGDGASSKSTLVAKLNSGDSITLDDFSVRVNSIDADAEITVNPTVNPPTVNPTVNPPTVNPTQRTQTPTKKPTDVPTVNPTQQIPTKKPTDVPTVNQQTPTKISIQPTLMPRKTWPPIPNRLPISKRQRDKGKNKYKTSGRCRGCYLLGT